MADVVRITGGQTPQDDFAVLVERESDAQHQVVAFDRHAARFVYGPRSFASREEATRLALAFAEQYDLPRVYVH
jgi:hypothetical protein